jgi:hypothetical protein
LIARHSESSSQRTHSFIFFRLAMTVPKQSLAMRGKAFPRVGAGFLAVAGLRPAHNLLMGVGLST